ncbi:MAG: hypothetical protein AAFY98_06365, partial [Verrucomicrobiota bacterium]
QTKNDEKDRRELGIACLSFVFFCHCISPGCSSFDMFQNFQDRGNQFRQAVHRLTQNIAITGEIQ